jgi:hypothetical protein
MAPVVPRPEPEVLSRSRRWARLAAVGLLSVTAATGVITGKSVTATPAARPEPARAQVSSPARLAAAPTVPLTVEPAAVGPVAIAPAEITPAEIAPAETVSAEIASPVAGTRQVQVTAPVRPQPASGPRVASPAYAPAAASAPPPPTPVAYRDPPAPVAAPAPTRIVVDCDRDPDACFAARIEWADRRTGEAFETAAAAGVRPRLLREYRSEWNRARGQANDRPADALRILAMITHDLRQLTHRADAR